MLKALLIIGLPGIALTTVYIVLARKGYRRQLDNFVQMALWVGGVALVVVLILLASKGPGSAEIADAIEKVVRWLQN